MNREKRMVLMLLDFCAFAYSQNRGEEERKALDSACRLADEYSMPEARLYRHIMGRLDLEMPEKESREKGFSDARPCPLSPA